MGMTCFLLHLSHLKILENEGLLMKNFNKNIKGAVFIVSAGFFGAHRLAGLQESFRVEKVCLLFTL